MHPQSYRLQSPLGEAPHLREEQELMPGEADEGLETLSPVISEVRSQALECERKAARSVHEVVPYLPTPTAGFLSPFRV